MRASPSLTLRQVAGAAYAGRVPADVDPALTATRSYDPPPTYSNACIACVVEVDVETGHVTVKRLVAVEDCGTVLNQMLADGTLKSEQAIMALQFCQQNDMTLEQAFTALEWKLTGEDPVTQMRSPWVETGTHQSPTKRFGDILNR